MQDVPKIFRITIQVADIREGAAFYSELLGIEGRSVRGARHYFDCGTVILVILAPDGGAQPNPDDIYFSVANLEAVYARAKKLGRVAEGLVHGEPAGEILVRPWGERSFYAADPCGNELCFVDAGTVFTGVR